MVVTNGHFIWLILLLVEIPSAFIKLKVTNVMHDLLKIHTKMEHSQPAVIKEISPVNASFFCLHLMDSDLT